MKHICGWCGKEIEEQPDPGWDSITYYHGQNADPPREEVFCDNVCTTRFLFKFAREFYKENAEFISR